MPAHKKPQGRSGPIQKSGNGPLTWLVIDFPAEKAVRELMIAEMFVRAANRHVMFESVEHPSYRPFGNLFQNEESDLDFTITTSRGLKRMDIVEFAPLHKFGPRFEDAPRELGQSVKSELLLELIKKKSILQGGVNRILLVYNTEHAFCVDPMTIELVRRVLSIALPRFEKIYYLTCHNNKIGGVSEIFPGKPNHVCGDWTDEILRRPAHFPHPHDILEVARLPTVTTLLPYYGEAKLRIRHSTRLALTFESRGQDFSGGFSQLMVWTGAEG